MSITSEQVRAAVAAQRAARGEISREVRMAQSRKAALAALVARCAA